MTSKLTSIFVSSCSDKSSFSSLSRIQLELELVKLDESVEYPRLLILVLGEHIYSRQTLQLSDSL